MARIRVLHFADGVVVAPPSGARISASGLVVFPDTASFEALYGAGQEGDRFLNSTDNLQYTYVNGAWKALSADEMVYDNTTSGMAADKVQSAIDELDASLEAHIVDADDAHDASAISYDNVSSGLTATDAQAAIDEVLAHSDQVAIDLAVHEADTSNPHSVTQAQVGLDQVDNTSDADKPVSTAQQAALDAKLNLDGTNVMTGALDMGTNNITNVGTVDGRDVSADGAAADAHIAATNAHGVSGVVAGTQGSTFDTMGISFEDIATDLADIAILPTKIGVRMTGLTAIRNLVGINPLNTGELVLVNDSGFALTIVNEHVGTTDANKIITGTGAAISLAPGASLKLTYDSTETRWRVIGGTGSGSGGGGGMEVVSISAAQTLAVNRHYLVDSSGGGFSLTLPDPAGFTAEDLLAAMIIVEDSALATATPANEFSVLPHSGGQIANNSAVLAVDESLVHDRRGWAVEYSWDDTLGHWKAQDYLGASGGQYTRTRIPLADNATTSVQNFSAFDAAELFGWVYINATTSYRFYLSAQVSKTGDGSDYNVSYQTSGDTPPVGFDVSISAAGLLSVTLPSEAGFVEADINYSLNVATETAALPLSIDAGTIQTGTVDPARLPTPSSTQIWLNHGNGYGSTNTKIRRYQNAQVNDATWGTLTQSAADGDSVTITEAGVYEVSRTDVRVGGSCTAGVTINTATPTVSITSVGMAAEERIGLAQAPDGLFAFCSGIVFCSPGDIIRPHDDGTCGNFDNRQFFRVRQVVKL